MGGFKSSVYSVHARVKDRVDSDHPFINNNLCFMLGFMLDGATYQMKVAHRNRILSAQSMDGFALQISIYKTAMM